MIICDLLLFILFCFIFGELKSTIGLIEAYNKM